MNDNPPLSTRENQPVIQKLIEISIPITILIIGGTLRFYKLGFKSLWADEGITWILAKFDVPAHGHPHLFFSIVGFIMKLFGETEFALRLLSAGSGTLLLIISYLITRKLFDKRIASLQMLILAISPVAIYSSQNARMYSLCTLGMMFSLYFFIKAIENDFWKYWLFFAVLNAFNLLIDHTSAFPLIAYFIFIFIKKEIIPGRMKKFLYSGLFTTLLYSYELPKTYLNLSFMSEGGYASKISTISAFPVKFAQLSYYLSTGYILYPINKDILKNPPYAVFFIVSFIFIGFTLAIGVYKLFMSSDIGKCLLLAGFISLFLQVILSGYLPYKLVFPLTLFTMVLSIGLNYVKSHWRKVIFLLYLVIVAFNLNHYYSLDSLPSHPENWRNAANYLKMNANPDELIHTTGNRNGLFTLRFYLGDTKLKSECRTPEVDLLGDYDYERTKRYDFELVLKNGIKNYNRMWVLFEDWGSVKHKTALKEIIQKYPKSRYVQSFGSGLQLFLLER